MPISVSITEGNIFTVLRAFLLSILPAGTPVIRGQQNRVPEPVNTNFVVMIPLFRERISTNFQKLEDAIFVGSITGTTLNITSIAKGAVIEGSQIYAAGIAAGTVITGLVSGTGGVGTYTINNSQTINGEAMEAGTAQVTQCTKVTIQVDVHGPVSADNVQIISTLFRDSYGTRFFKASGFDLDALYASDPHQIPFVNAEQQYEERWTIDLLIEANPVITVPQQSFETVEANLTSVTKAYPPT